LAAGIHPGVGIVRQREFLVHRVPHMHGAHHRQGFVVLQAGLLTDLNDGKQAIQKERNTSPEHVEPEYQNRCYNLGRMTPVPCDLPLRPSEASALAELIYEHAEGKRLTEDVRNRLAGRANQMKFESLTPYLGSLEKDPVH